MRTIKDQQSAFRAPWDRILGAESHVRSLRVLDATDEPMSVRELARRARVQLRSTQLAIQKLESVGLVERVGSGARQQMRLRQTHPLAPAVHALFAAERARVDRVLSALKQAARAVPQADAVWVEGPVAEGVDGIEGVMAVGVLARSADLDALVDALRASTAEVMRREDLTLEIHGWTRADLDALAAERRVALDTAIPLLGALPVLTRAMGRRKPRSHGDADADLLRRAEAVAQLLGSYPELVRQAREEVERRLVAASAQEARTLREWQQLLAGLSLPRLRRWLVDPGPRATRLRQSMPLTLLHASNAGSPGRAG